MDLTRLQRYLEGIQERRSIWVGYLYNGNNMRIAADGSPASSVILDDSNFVNGSNGGEDGICIGIEEGKLFSAPCFNLFPCICQHHYDGMLCRNEYGFVCVCVCVCGEEGGISMLSI